MVDEKQGRKVPFIITEDEEQPYVELFGGDRIASLGGRGGSWTCAMRRIASVNNNWCPGGMGGGLAPNATVSRASWRPADSAPWVTSSSGPTPRFSAISPPNISGETPACRSSTTTINSGSSNTHTALLRREVGTSSPDDGRRFVRERFHGPGGRLRLAISLDRPAPAPRPSFLAVLADHAEALARQAYQRFTGTEPNLYAAAYDQDAFHRDGYDVVKDKLFKTERLRQLWVSARRSQEMCGVALAHRLAQRLIVEGAPAADVLKHFDQAIAFAKANQLIYQLNYHDDYDATDGLCAKSRISWKRNAPHSPAPPAKPRKRWPTA